MFVSLKRYKEMKKSYAKAVEIGTRANDLVKEVYNSNGRLITLCKQLLDENKSLRAEIERLKGDEIGVDIERFKGDEIGVEYEVTDKELF